MWRYFAGRTVCQSVTRPLGGPNMADPENSPDKISSQHSTHQCIFNHNNNINVIQETTV